MEIVQKSNCGWNEKHKIRVTFESTSALSEAAYELLDAVRSLHESEADDSIGRLVQLAHELRTRRREYEEVRDVLESPAHKYLIEETYKDLEQRLAMLEPTNFGKCEKMIK